MTFATQPSANVSLAFAMSMLDESTGTPTASIRETGRPHRGEDEVDVVDHEVEHDGDVRAARDEDAQPVRLDEPRTREDREGRADGGVEALGVTHLDEKTALARGRHEVAGLLEGRGDRLLDEDVNAAFEAPAGHAVVGARGHRDHGGVDPPDQIVHVGERRRPELGRDRRRPRCVAVVDPDELARGELGRHARVVPPEMACSDDSELEHGVSSRRGMPADGARARP